MPTYRGKAVALELQCLQFLNHRIFMFGDIPMCDEAARSGRGLYVFDQWILLCEWQRILSFFSLGTGEMAQRVESLPCKQEC